MSPRRILIVDDHPMFRDALRAVLTSDMPGAEIREASSFDELSGLLETDAEFDLILLDLKMPGVQGLSGLSYLRAQFPAVPVAIVSGLEETAVMHRAMALGAAGFIPKSTPAQNIRSSISSFLEGQNWLPDGTTTEQSDAETVDLIRRLKLLTPQQTRVLMMVREGKLNKQIAFHLSVSEATIKAHVSAILQKLDVDSRTQAVIAASKIDGLPALPQGEG